MKLPVPEAHWSDTIRCAYNYFVMGSSNEPPSSLIFSNDWKSRNVSEFYLFRQQYQKRISLTISEIGSCLPPPASVLDIGGAQGGLALPLAALGYDVTINDLRKEVFDFLDVIQETNEGHQRVVGDVFRVNFERRFDIVFAGEVIEHVAHPDRFLKRCAELVNPEGYIILTTPNGNWLKNKLRCFSDFTEAERVALEADQFKPDDDGHIFALRRYEIFRLAGQAGLRVQKIRYLTPTVRLDNLPICRRLTRIPLLNRYLNATVLIVCHPERSSG
jgi:2-polyprenyl-3-methyl-5-hydroxy-6-metoxy-1,4-benzoquinol methylase